jgi:hypothetical protein
VSQIADQLLERVIPELDKLLNERLKGQLSISSQKEQLRRTATPGG